MKYEAEYVVHLNVTVEVEAENDATAQKRADADIARLLDATPLVRDNLVFHELHDLRQKLRTTAAHIDAALAEYKRVVEVNGTMDAVCRAMRDEPGYEGLGMSGPTNIAYEVTESMPEGVIVDLDEPGVYEAVIAGLHGLCAVWQFALDQRNA